MSQTLIRILLITVSTRPGRLGPTITDWFLHATHDVAAEAGVRFDVADLAAIALPLLDEAEHPSTGMYGREHTRRWSRIVQAAHAIVVVTPEYNYAMPATLKNAMDYLSQEWAWKPIGFVSYGNTSAGTRAVVMAKQVATTLRMVPTGATVALRINDETDNGRMRPNDERDQTARALVREIARLARILRPLHRSTEPAAQPLPQGLTLIRADETDAADLLVLQRCCWVQEALDNRTLELPALGESLDDVAEWVGQWKVWCLFAAGRLVGAVRAQSHGRDWNIGRLMIAPDHAGQGLGRWLLQHAEHQIPAGAERVTLATGARSARNLRIYRQAGYAIDTDHTTSTSVYMSKNRSSADSPHPPAAR